MKRLTVKDLVDACRGISLENVFLTSPSGDYAVVMEGPFELFQKGTFEISLIDSASV
jgi:hypothetical protein